MGIKQSVNLFHVNRPSMRAMSLSTAALLTLGACSGGGDGYRSNLDQYVEFESTAVIKSHAMSQGTAVYVDFSDGMNAAYGTETSREALRKVINVFTGSSNQASFYSLANDTIVPLDLPQTGIYNAIMSGKNYTKPKAPIEKTLKEIIAKKQPALLITDFEEYNGGVIQQQNYAKDYFIKWLTMGYDIIFYKIDYNEGIKPKHLYFTVFDAPQNSLAANVETALSSFIDNGMERFVLAGPQTSYALALNYPSSSQGGNYHGVSGEDMVSGVLEDGKEEAYITYNYNLADTEGAKTHSNYAQVYSLYGPLTEYYPIGVKWEDIVTNISAMQEQGIEPGDRFNHFLSNIYVNFTVQDGYDIQEIKANAYNFEPAIQQIIEGRANAQAEGKEYAVTSAAENGKEVLDMFTASIEPAKVKDLPGNGWQLLSVDLDTRFKGQLGASFTAPTDLIKINVTVAKATPKLEALNDFFAWPGNNSLVESVRNTLQNPEVNPEGKVIVTYYLKAL